MNPGQNAKGLTSLAVFSYGNYFYSTLLAGSKLVQALRVSSDLFCSLKIESKLKQNHDF